MAPLIWLVTAAGNGFGKAIAQEALARGNTVYATGRSRSRIAATDLEGHGAIIRELDVTWDVSRLRRVVDDIVGECGRIDVLINAAGYILEGAIEETSAEESLAQFTTNVLGMMNVVRAVLPHMRAQRSGVIANFGSLGSWRGGPAYGNYAGTKWACSGISESLTAELKPFGIDVVVIEPGYFRTGFLNPGARVQSEQTIDDYTSTVTGEVRQRLTQTDNNQPGDVIKGAKVIVDVLTKTGTANGREIPMRLPLGTDVSETIKTKCRDTLALLDEWDSVITSTDF